MPDLVQEKQLEVSENISDQSQVHSSEAVVFSYFSYITFFTEDSEISFRCCNCLIELSGICQYTTTELIFTINSLIHCASA